MLMKLSAMKDQQTAYTQIAQRVLAVLLRRIDGWCVYIDAVPGQNHDSEWLNVLHHGDKVRESLARAIVENYFHPGFEVDLPYAY